jgi:hypothetical protein
MSVQVRTKDLIGLLQALVHTAASEPDEGSIHGVLLHTARGYASAEPGKSGLLVGTSTDTTVVGHTWTLAAGAIRPTLWPLGEVRAVIGVLRQMSRNDKEHCVDIRADGDQVTVEEAETLLGAGASYTFDAGDASVFPPVWRVLTDAPIRPSVVPDEDGHEVPAGLRTVVTESMLAPFAAIAKARSEPIEIYRYHQRLPVLLAIGSNYRGALMPLKQPDDYQAAQHPEDGVYPADLPPPRKKNGNGPATRLDLSQATGLLAEQVLNIVSPHL